MKFWYTFVLLQLCGAELIYQNDVRCDFSAHTNSLSSSSYTVSNATECEGECLGSCVAAQYFGATGQCTTANYACKTAELKDSVNDVYIGPVIQDTTPAPPDGWVSYPGDRCDFITHAAGSISHSTTTQDNEGVCKSVCTGQSHCIAYQFTLGSKTCEVSSFACASDQLVADAGVNFVAQPAAEVTTSSFSDFFVVPGKQCQVPDGVSTSTSSPQTPTQCRDRCLTSTCQSFELEGTTCKTIDYVCSAVEQLLDNHDVTYYVPATAPATINTETTLAITDETTAASTDAVTVAPTDAATAAPTTQPPTPEITAATEQTTTQVSAGSLSLVQFTTAASHCGQAAVLETVPSRSGIECANLCVKRIGCRSLMYRDQCKLYSTDCTEATAGEAWKKLV